MVPLSVGIENLEKGYEVLINGRLIETDQKIGDGQEVGLRIQQKFGSVLEPEVDVVQPKEAVLIGEQVGGKVVYTSRIVTLDPRGEGLEIGGVVVEGIY